MKKFIKEHKILFCSIVFSLLMSIIFSFFLFLNNFSEMSDILFFVLILLLPVALIALISFAGIKISVKHPKITKIITGILITFILFFQILIYFSVFCAALMFANPDEQNYNAVQDYSKALNSIHAPICVRHFPETIPENAENIKMQKTENSWFGSEDIFLKFDINKEYIKNELKKYKFNYIEKYDTSDHSFLRKFGFILTEMQIPYEKQKDFTFYIINDKESEVPSQNSFLYHYGIVANKNKTTIIYYYINPD